MWDVMVVNLNFIGKMVMAVDTNQLSYIESSVDVKICKWCGNFFGR